MRDSREIRRKKKRVEQKDWYYDGPVIDAVIEQGFIQGLEDLLDEDVSRGRLKRFKSEENYSDDFNRKADLGYLLAMTWVQEKDHPFGGKYP